MISPGGEGGYRGLLATAFHYYVRLEVWQGGTRVDTFGLAGLPKLDGSISATLQNRVARQLTLSLPTQFAPDDIKDPTYLLSPLNKEIRAFAVYNDTYVFPVFRGRIRTVSYDSDSSSVGITCADLGQDILDDEFSAPRNSKPNFTIVDQYVSLITETLADATFSNIGSFFGLMPKLTWNVDRGQACDDCATSVNAYWYALADGSFTLQTVPWTVISDPVLTLTNGDGGILVNYRLDADRGDVFNRVVVTGERSDGTTPVHAVATDLDAASPTYFNGDFGHRTKTVQIQSATTTGQATGLATQQVLISRSFKEAWSASCPPDASMELGDAHELIDNKGRNSVQVLAGFTLPIVKGSMSLTYRAQVNGVVLDGS